MKDFIYSTYLIITVIYIFFKSLVILVNLYKGFSFAIPADFLRSWQNQGQGSEGSNGLQVANEIARSAMLLRLKLLEYLNPNGACGLTSNVESRICN